MQTVQEYLTQQRENIASMQKELAILEAASLNLFVTKNNHGRREFEIRNYSLADKVLIEQFSSYGVEHDLIQFMHEVRTPFGNISVYCRHDDWHNDERRYAQESFISLPQNTRRHYVPALLDFYQRSGVKSKLLKELRQLVKSFYRQPTPEEQDLYPRRIQI